MVELGGAGKADRHGGAELFHAALSLGRIFCNANQNRLLLAEMETAQTDIRHSTAASDIKHLTILNINHYEEIEHIKRDIAIEDRLQLVKISSILFVLTLFSIRSS